MNKMINVAFMCDDALATLKENSEKVKEYIDSNKHSSEWIKKLYSGKIYDVKKEKVKDFELKVSSSDNYKEVELENAITLYETLKDLPKYMLTDERFWAWINLEKGYRATIQAMPVKTPTTFRNMWLFGQGRRRGNFFGANSRLYYWVALSVDESLEDKYAYTRFVFEKRERIRHLTWRTNSNNRRIILNVIKSEKKLYDRYASDPEYKETYLRCETEKNHTSIYSAIAKFLSLYGSVRILDVISDEDLQKVIYDKLESFLFEVHKGNWDVLN